MKRSVMTVMAAVGLGAVVLPASMASGAEPPSRSGPSSIAVLGDAPYGANQPDTFPQMIEAINADPDVRAAIHLGDTKAGSARCDDEHYERIYDDFQLFADPLYYVPGDNEWTDCHRANNGGYVPTERLDLIRDTYFTDPGKAVNGIGRRVETQASEGYPEHQTWTTRDVQVTTLHVVGSNNGAAPWFGDDQGGTLTAAREAEVAERTAAAIAWMHHAFDEAEQANRKGAMFVWHGDLWAPYEGSNGIALDATDDFVQQFAARAADFGKPVLIVNGDSHDFYLWHPLSDIDTHPLAEFNAALFDLSEQDSDYYHGEVTRADNVRQVVFDVYDGYAPEPDEYGPEDFGWLEVGIDPSDPAVFSVEQHWLDLEPAS